MLGVARSPALSRVWGRLLPAAALFACIAAAFAAVWILLPLPADLLQRAGDAGVTIVDRSGTHLRSTRAHDGSIARWVPYAEVDPDLINAFVAVEDRRFWEHHGVDVSAVLRAVRDNTVHGRVTSGASTLTMQLARLVRPVPRSVAGKLAQAMWALRLERHLSKQEILEQYLNRVHLGQATTGVAAASELYFGTSVSELSLSEAATLAGIAHAPSADNPHVSAKRARERRAVALERMHRMAFVTREEMLRSQEEPLVRGARKPPFLAPHFTTRVISWIDAGAAAGVDTVHRTVRTTIDMQLQGALEDEVRHTVEMLRERGVAHAALVVLDNASGDVLAWVGSPDFWASDAGQTDMVVSERQPGSALKPFLYALAVDRGYTAATVLPDIPRAYATATGPYRPRNYDRKFRGPVRVREALASSYNVPAVELASRLGTGSLLHTLHLAGFASLNRQADHYGLGLALGNGDVALIELANAYRALANSGEWRPWMWRMSGAKHAGAAAQADARRVASPLASAIVLDILQDPAARAPGFGFTTPFDFPFPVAVKTGTSRHFTDNWAVGVTRGFTIAVWAGNFSGRPMEGVSGVAGAGPLLHRAVMETARRVQPGMLTTPAELGASSVEVCRLSGLRASETCRSMREWFAPGTEPQQVDHWERGGRIELPEEFAEWSQQRNISAIAGVTLPSVVDSTAMLGGTGGAASPARVDNAALSNVPIRIVSPQNGDRYSIPAGIDSRYATIALRAAGRDAATVRWLVDGVELTGSRWALIPGSHVIEAISGSGHTAKISIVVEPQ